MSDEHPSIALARRLWSAVADGDGDTLRDLLTDNVVWRAYGESPIGDEYVGPDQVLDHLAQVGESADELRSNLYTIFYNDEGAVLFYGTDARVGAKRLEMDYLLMLRFQEGRVTAAFSVPTDQHEADRFWREARR